MQHEPMFDGFQGDAQPKFRKRDCLPNANKTVWNVSAAEHATVDAQHRGS
jgi:hypothetical protein